MGLSQRIPTPYPNYNDTTAYLVHELRETKQQLIDQIEVLSQRIEALERWRQCESSKSL